MGRFFIILLALVAISQSNAATVAVDSLETIVVQGSNSLNSGVTGWWILNGGKVSKRDVFGNVQELGDLVVQINGLSSGSHCLSLAYTLRGQDRFGIRVKPGQYTITPGADKAKIVIAINDILACYANR